MPTVEVLRQTWKYKQAEKPGANIWHTWQSAPMSVNVPFFSEVFDTWGLEKKWYLGASNKTNYTWGVE